MFSGDIDFALALWFLGQIFPHYRRIVFSSSLNTGSGRPRHRFSLLSAARLGVNWFANACSESRLKSSRVKSKSNELAWSPQHPTHHGEDCSGGPHKYFTGTYNIHFRWCNYLRIAKEWLFIWPTVVSKAESTPCFKLFSFKNGTREGISRHTAGIPKWSKWSVRLRFQGALRLVDVWALK